MAQGNSRFLETVVERLMECSSGRDGGICVSFVSMKKGKTQGTQNFKFNALLGNSFLLLDDYKTGLKSKIFYEAANRWVKKLLSVLLIPWALQSIGVTPIFSRNISTTLSTVNYCYSAPIGLWALTLSLHLKFFT